MKEETIAAISTPIGVGGISIIRMSGPFAFEIANRVFFLTNQKTIEPRKAYLGFIKCDDFLEECLMIRFKGPYSYTGEDLVEFQCHGGFYVTQKILQLLIASGCRMAGAGEFTKKAFINGKITLDKAEGVIDIINAETKAQAVAGQNLLKGNLYKEVKVLQDKLTDLIAKTEVALDYPEEDLEKETEQDILYELKNVLNEIHKIVKTNKTGKIIKNGCRVLLLGKTNVGKSSLMNAMLNYEKAIVTDINGTTRDILEDSYDYKGMKFIIFDTAGIRNTEDIVEKIGVKKALEAINDCDLILYLVDSSNSESFDENILKNELIDRNLIIVVNKCDLNKQLDVSKYGHKMINISAKNNINIEELKELIYRTVIDESVVTSNLVITNERHFACLNKAMNSITHSIESIENIMSLDVVLLDMKECWMSLGEITGEMCNEEIIDRIFTKFCVGK